MEILYGVVGEGMGHATRSAVVLDHLLSRGHEIKVVVSGKAHAFLKTRFSGRPGFAIEEIHGITLRYFGNKVDRTGSLFWNLINSPKAVRKNVEVYQNRPSTASSTKRKFVAAKDSTSDWLASL
jgi:uncharacterized protein (TIGR00661 family)